MLKILTAFVNGSFWFLAVAHTAIGMMSPAQNSERVWFFGTGLALAVFALLYHDARRQLYVNRLATTNWVIGNILLIAFTTFASSTIPDPTNYLVLGVSVLSFVLLYLSERREIIDHRAVCCCKTASKVYAL